MALPPLYKFMGLDGAKATLGTRSFRHAKPSEFNDKADLTIESIFPEDLATAFQAACEGMVGVIVSHLDEEPTCSPQRAAKIKELQAALRLDPNLAQAMVAAAAQVGLAGLGSSEAMEALAHDTIKDLNVHFQAYRVFCTTTHRDSEKMWNDYAEGHRGIALRIQPNIAKDSHLRLFRKVEYREQRPPLYNNTLEFLTGSFFGDQVARNRKMADATIYTKTLQWQDEEEYRVAAPDVVEGDLPWDAPFHPDEIPELYLGSAMPLADMTPIIQLARRANPAVRIFQAERAEDDSLTYRELLARG